MEAEDKHGRARRWWRGFLRPLLIVAVVALPLKSSVADWNWVPSGSMKPTILEGDVVLVNKLAFDLKIPFTLKRLARWADPVRGDIVIFFDPQESSRTVKRVVAAPGDTIEMRENVLLVNGVPLHYEPLKGPLSDEIRDERGAVMAKEREEHQPHWVMAQPWRWSIRAFGPVRVGAGKYYVLGDSRDNSVDSRFFGLVERKAIIGRVRRVLLSFDVNDHYKPRPARFGSRLDQ